MHDKVKRIISNICGQNLHFEMKITINNVLNHELMAILGALIFIIVGIKYFHASNKDENSFELKTKKIN